MQMKKIVVATREEALKLIASGTNSMLVFSPEAPYGYKKSGEPAAARGRKPLSEERKVAREAKAVSNGKRVRAKTGPVAKTEDAPFGVRKDGTPMKKRGRPSKDVADARRTAAAAEREAKLAERVARKAAKKAEREAVKAALLSKVATTALDQPMETQQEQPTSEVPVVPVVRSPALEVTEFKEGMRVRLRETACVSENSFSLTGVVTKVSENFAFVEWDDGASEYRSTDVIEAIA